jgi:hypothetical protein
MIRILFILVLCGAAFVGYQLFSDPLTAENLDKIEVGMKVEEVVELIGEPDEIKKAELLGSLASLAEQHIWRSGDREVTIGFAAGLVAAPPIRKGF